MCSFGEADLYPGENLFETVERARAARVCAECGLPIPAGERHLSTLYEKTWEEGPYSWARDHVHRACAKLAERAAEVACGSREYAIGELEEHLEYAEEALFAEANPDYEPSYEIDWIDPDDARELLRDADAIEQRYSGIDYELGGEGG